jgi:murein DD-endopeptidase MepM/ murein hydrolase activator NlpD
MAPPGPAPAPVAAPGLEPVMEPLPPPVVPLPGWVTAPRPVQLPTFNLGALPPLNATGHAEMTRDQLLADGALDAGGFIPPIQGVITTFWGGSTPWQSFHPGLDIAAPKDTPVHAAADGIVVYAGLAVPGAPTLSYGNCVLIEHASGIVTLYGHMDLGQYGLQVQVGEVVRQGQVIGYEGETGFATGPHVHFEMRVDNVAFNPLLLLNIQQITG